MVITKAKATQSWRKDGCEYLYPYIKIYKVNQNRRIVQLKYPYLDMWNQRPIIIFIRQALRQKDTPHARETTMKEAPPIQFNCF